MSWFKKFVFFALLFVILHSLSGCFWQKNSDETNPMAASTTIPPTSDTTVTFSNTFTLATSVIQLKSELANAITIGETVGSSTFLSGPPTNDIVVGSVLVGVNLATGPMKVIGISNSGGNLRLETIPAALNEVFKDASFTYEGPLSKVKETTTASIRARFGEAAISPSVRADTYQGEYIGQYSLYNLDLLDGNMALTFSNELADPFGEFIGGNTGESSSEKLSVKGTAEVKLKELLLTYDPRIKIAYQISDGDLLYFYFQGTGDLHSQMTVTTKLDGEIKAAYETPPVIKGVVPIVVAPLVAFLVNIDIPLVFAAGATGKIETISKFDYVTKAAFGVKYAWEDGWSLTDNNTLTTDGTSSFAATGSVGLFCEIGCKVKPSVMYMNTAGLGTSLAMAAQLSETIRPSKPWILDVALKIKGGLDLETKVAEWFKHLPGIVVRIVKWAKLNSMKWQIIKAKPLLIKTWEYDINGTPTVDITSAPPRQTSLATPTFGWIATDSERGVDGYIGLKTPNVFLVSIDKDPPDIPWASTTWTVDPPLTLGTHTFRVMAIDLCDATSSTAVYEFLATTSTKLLTGITLSPAAGTVAVGAAYDLGGVVVTATYEDKSTAQVKDNVVWSGAGVSGFTFSNTQVTGTIILTCNYTENKISKTAEFVITVASTGTTTPKPTSKPNPTPTPTSDTVSLSVAVKAWSPGQTITVSLEGGPSVTFHAVEAMTGANSEPAEVTKGEHVLTVTYRVDPVWTHPYPNDSDPELRAYGVWEFPSPDFGFSAGRFSSAITGLSEGIPRTGSYESGYTYTWSHTITVE